MPGFDSINTWYYKLSFHLPDAQPCSSVSIRCRAWQRILLSEEWFSRFLRPFAEIWLSHVLFSQCQEPYHTNSWLRSKLLSQQWHPPENKAAINVQNMTNFAKFWSVIWQMLLIWDDHHSARMPFLSQCFRTGNSSGTSQFIAHFPNIIVIISSTLRNCIFSSVGEK